LTLAISFKKFGSPLGLQLSNGSPFGSVQVHSLTLSYIPRSMKCDSPASLLAHTSVSLYFGREPKVRVMTRLEH